MPIFFGWGHTTRKVFGPAFKQHCSHCNNEEYWILTRIRVWFTLFFIPIFPYENKYHLACPICEYGITLNSEQISSIKPLAELNQQLVEGQITKEEYQRRVLSLDGNTAPTEAVKVHDVEPETVRIDTPDSSKRFCSECGKEVTTKAKFCGSCGSSTEK
ncbi:zinc-ribbon domain-containing protein [Candidatus Nomurabacteria bacterium]|nr:zinc-ribbon domain-containing protein [Candidatus Nomurabacteria bacterium]MCB9818016.1 zinc-ribbon domain-containing protein [Candidatus Nomurabacteria bacterium]